MAGGARYPYPKEVWSPTGGWWSRPANWKLNTLMSAVVITGATAIIWSWSAKREERLAPPNKPIPSRYWSPHAREIGVKVE